MPIKISIDERLLEEAKVVGRHDSNTEAVNEALLRYIRIMKQKDIESLFGTIEYDEEHDYKKQRKIV